MQVVLLVLEVHACIAEESHHFHHLVSYLIRTFHNNHFLLEKYVKFQYLQLTLLFNYTSLGFIGYMIQYLVNILENNGLRCFYRRGALIVRRLCVLLGAEKVYREFSTILESEVDLDFASVMVQVCPNSTTFFYCQNVIVKLVHYFLTTCRL